MTSDMENSTQCYNRGCGKMFDAKNNTDGCQYHKGEPIFHDADKKWSCCNKRSRDFTYFLNIPGCSHGPHNPVEPTLKKPEENNVSEAPRQPVNRQALNMKKRPSVDAPLVNIHLTVADSLKKALQESMNNDSGDEDCSVDTETGVKIEEPCKRNGCKAVYVSASSNLDLCLHHPGGPVFHEGLKYWSCCSKKTTDFTEFLSQQGCTTAKHLWRDVQEESRVSTCRYDFHQTASHVCLTVYAKHTQPALSEVALSPVRLRASIHHQENCVFALDIELAQTIDPSKSSVTLYAAKVEVKLKKEDALTWTRYEIPPANNATKANAKQEQRDVTQDLDIDAVDLSDL